MLPAVRRTAAELLHEGIGVVHGQDEAAVLMASEIEHDRAFPVVNVEERPAAVLWAWPRWVSPNGGIDRPILNPSRPGGSVSPIETGRSPCTRCAAFASAS